MTLLTWFSPNDSERRSPPLIGGWLRQPTGQASACSSSQRVGLRPQAGAFSSLGAVAPRQPIPVWAPNGSGLASDHATSPRRPWRPLSHSTASAPSACVDLPVCWLWSPLRDESLISLPGPPPEMAPVSGEPQEVTLRPPLDVQLRQPSVQPGRDPPVGAAQQVHDGGHEQHPHHRRIDEDRRRHSDTDHLQHDVGTGDERGEPPP